MKDSKMEEKKIADDKIIRDMQKKISTLINNVIELKKVSDAQRRTIKNLENRIIAMERKSRQG